MSLQVITSVEAMQKAGFEARTRGKLALVPTMGALHEGHLSLVRAAKTMSDRVVVSIFVNPLQFSPQEDFGSYPRTREQDLALLEQENVSMVFAPSVEEMYPDRSAGTFVDLPEVGGRLDGRSRPGHFRGVATVVTKLFHIVGPHLALFGQKDAAQVAVLKTMARDLNFPVDVVTCPTVREADGLAMSSRNRYLSATEREQALVLYRSLCAAEQAAKNGEVNPEALRRVMQQTIAQEPAAKLEYAEVVTPDTLLPLQELSQDALLAVAAHVGTTRLIDNILLPAQNGGTR